MNKQGHKTRGNLPAGGFLVIGRDVASVSDSNSVKPRTAKREYPLLTSSGCLKKPRLDFLAKKSSTVSSPAGCSKRSEEDDCRWRNCCANIYVEPIQLLASLESAKEKQKPHKAVRLMCATIRELIDHRKEVGSWVTEPILCSTIMLFVKENGSFLPHEELVDALCSLLSNVFTSSSELTMVLSLLCHLLIEKTEWNWRLVESFIGDSLYDRRWVDQPAADELVCNIMTAFGTEIPHESIYMACDISYPDRYRDVPVTDRFAKVSDKKRRIEIFVVQMRDICERKGESAPRNLLKTMCFCAGNDNIRSLAARRMDSWLLNGRLQRYAMELLLWIACNMGHTELIDEHSETLNALLKLRALKSKQINSLFNVALKEILNKDQGMIYAVAKLLLSNEFSAVRFPYNMTIIHSLFSFDNRIASKVIAREIIQVLAIKEEYLRISKTFLREFVRSLLRIDFDFKLFTSYMLNAVTEDFSPSSTPAFFFKSVIDLCTVLPFLAITAAVRDGAQQNRSSNGNLTQIQFYSDLRNFFEICTHFLHKHHEFCSDNGLFVYSYYRILYLASNDYYVTVDQWPVEADVAQYMRVISDVPLNEQILLNILEACCDPSVPIEAADTMDILENLTKRAAMSSTLTGGSLIPISSCSLLETLFKITVYKPPPAFNILRDDLPCLAVKTLYWKAWLISLMWTSLNKDTLVKEVYNKYPNLKVLMQIVLTWNYSFPPLADMGNTESAEKMVEDDEKAAFDEKIAIKTLEARLAGTEVNDSDSKLLNKLCSLNMTGVCRRPPDSFMNELETLNGDLDLSHSLSECRDPDLLADIVKSQGSSKALPSIMKLVESNSKLIAHLPLGCICQLFLHYMIEASSLTPKKTASVEKMNAMLLRLRNAVIGPNATKTSVLETLDYLITHLASHSLSKRCAAAHSLSLLLDSDPNVQVLPVVPNNTARTSSLHRIAFFSELQHRICVLLSQACFVESDIYRLADYLNFLSGYADSKNMHLVAHSISNLDQRLKYDAEANEIRQIALSFYKRYIESVAQNEAEWTEELEVLLPTEVIKVTVMIEEPNQNPQPLKMISSAVFGMLELLCNNWKEADKPIVQVLKEFWFPSSGNRPKVLSADGVELLPDPVKLKMLQNEDERIARIAVEVMGMREALKFVQSFALTSYSCTKLFAILDADETLLEGELLEEAEKAVMFMKGYKLGGAEGGDKFLNRVNEAKSRQSNVKMEMDTVHIKWNPPPSIFNSNDYSEERHLVKMSIQEVIDCIEQAAQFEEESEKWPSVLCEMGKSVGCSRAVISLLKVKPAILTNEKIAVFLLNSLVFSRAKSDELSNDFDIMCNSVLNEPNLHLSRTVRWILCSRGGEYLVDMERPRSPNYDTYDPESILMRLANSVGMDDMQNRLVERFLDRCPEIIPCEDVNGNTKMHTILEILFSFKAPALRYIISLLPTQCTSKTLERIIGYLLESYRSQFISILVLQTVINTFRTFKVSTLSSEQCSVLIQYVLAEMPNNPNDIIKLVVKFIEDCAANRSELSWKLVAQLSDFLKSTENRQEKFFAQQIAEAFIARFPDARIIDNTLVVYSFCSIRTQDRVVHNVIVKLFDVAAIPDCPVNTNISTLAQIALHQPRVVIRHLPLISACLTMVVQLPARQLRTKSYQTILNYIPKLLIDLAPQSFEEDNCLQSILHSFFTLIENIDCGRIWIPLAKALQNVCVKYLELNTKAAKSYFGTRIEAIKQLCLCLKSPPSKILVDTIMRLDSDED